MSINSDQRVSMALQNEITVQEVAIIELTFPAPLPEECRCMMCEQLMRDPCHLTCCNSRYCQKCVDRLITGKHPCMNPKCRSTFIWKETSRADEAIKGVIDMLQVYCPMKVCGCQWIGKIKDLEAHLRWGEFNHDETTSCRFLPVACPNQCGSSVSRREMETHCRRDCNRRQIECPFCGLKDAAATINTVHLPSCQQRIVECSGGCGMPGIKENNLAHHLKEECPLRLVSCQHIGCDERFCFKDRSEHNKQRFEEHFHLMSEKVVALSQENEELCSLALSVQNTCNTLQQQYSTLLELMISRDEDMDDEDYLVMTSGPGSFINPPPIPARSPTLPNTSNRRPVVHNRTDSMRKAMADPNPPDLAAPNTAINYPRSNLPPRFSTLVATTSPVNLVEVGSWNVLPLPPRTNSTASETVHALPLPAETKREKPTPPSPPPRRDSLSSPSIKGQAKKRGPPTKCKPPRPRNLSMPNLLLEEGYDREDFQRRSRTWSNSSDYPPQENPCYTGYDIVTHRYETSTSYDRIVPHTIEDSGSYTANTLLSDDDIVVSYKTTESSNPTNHAFRRTCKSVDIDHRDENHHKLQASQSSDSVYVNMGRIRATVSNYSSAGTPGEITSVQTIKGNRLTTKGGSSGSSIATNSPADNTQVFHHTLLVNGQ